MDNKEKVALLIRVAKQIGDETARGALLTWAEELLSRSGMPPPEPNPDVVYPVSVFARHRGNKYDGQLLKDWKIERNGNLPSSPSAAAGAITGYPVNGWRFWRYINQHGQERPIDDIRLKSKKRIL
jgi:hypothetical protein